MARVVLVDKSEKTLEFFKGVVITDLLKKKDLQEKVWQALSNLLKFNVWIEGILSFNPQGYLELSNTELKQY